ncbi:Cullin binding-domain-containing protein, partial [Protomyces lactucae-debilis]
TNCNDATAQKYLKATRYNVESALDTYLRKHTGINQPSKTETKQLNDIFNTAAAVKTPKDDDIMQIDGTMQYLTDLGLDLEKAPVLAICMVLGAPTQGQFKRKPWLDGWRHLGVTKLQGMQEYTASLEQKLMYGDAQYDEALFKRTYLFTYGFALTPPSRTLDLETALAFWDVLFTGTGQTWALYAPWRSFCESKTRGVSRDVWNMIYDFSRSVKADLSDYDEMEAWPVLIDEFVAHCKGQKQ